VVPCRGLPLARGVCCGREQASWSRRCARKEGQFPTVEQHSFEMHEVLVTDTLTFTVTCTGQAGGRSRLRPVSTSTCTNLFARSCAPSSASGPDEPTGRVVRSAASCGATSHRQLAWLAGVAPRSGGVDSVRDERVVGTRGRGYGLRQDGGGCFLCCRACLPSSGRACRCSSSALCERCSTTCCLASTGPAVSSVGGLRCGTATSVLTNGGASSPSHRTCC
jgi:hypothetical protein